MRACKVNAWIGIGWIVACAALTSACTDSREMASDGQTHWLRGCDSDSECGELSCICGVCSKPCTSDRACDTLSASDATCSSADVLSGADRCEQASDAISLCLPTCARNADCADVAEGLVCQRGLCVTTPAMVDAGDSDATVTISDSGASDAGETTDAGESSSDSGVDASVDAGPDPLATSGPFEIDCGTIGTADAPPDVELMTSGSNLYNIAVHSGIVYGAGPNGVWLLPEPGAERESLTDPTGYVSVFVFEGEEMFYGRTGPAEPVTVVKMSLAAGDVLNLAVEPFPNIDGLVVDDDFVYWTGNNGMGGDQGRVSVLRSDREPGATTPIASDLAGWPVPGSLQLLDDWLYFAMQEFEGSTQVHAQLYRMPKDGSAAPEAFGDPQIMLTALVRDGADLIAARAGGIDDLGNPLGNDVVARVNLSDGSLEPLFSVERMHPEVPLSLDATYAYWVTTGRADGAQIWRGRKDGSGTPTVVVESTAMVWDVLADASGLYWTVWCNDDTYHLLRLDPSLL